MTTHSKRLSDINDILRSTTSISKVFIDTNDGLDHNIRLFMTEHNKLAEFISKLIISSGDVNQEMTSVPPKAIRKGSQDLVSSLISVHFIQIRRFINDLVDEINSSAIEIASIETEMFKLTASIHRTVREKGSDKFLSIHDNLIDHQANILAEIGRQGLEEGKDMEDPLTS